ncbi:MAG: hypothetical protein VYD87_13730 [Pseudomonadota bacterium]|nr:hypothetical protein [Pseudomonadota bacterium]MEE3099601.1 hypothetical protein [Pseudomonadota bacterium]
MTFAFDAKASLARAKAATAIPAKAAESAEGGASPPQAAATSATSATLAARPVPDAARLAATLGERGPLTQGAASDALGWGVSRTWRAEARLQDRGFIAHLPGGAAALTALWKDFEARNDPLDERAWR